LCAVDLANVVPAYVRFYQSGQAYPLAELRIERHAIVISGPPLLELPMNCSAVVAGLSPFVQALADAGALTRPTPESGPVSTLPIPQLTYGKPLEQIIEFERVLRVRPDPETRSSPP
jgi:hypothetical protein